MGSQGQEGTCAEGPHPSPQRSVCFSPPEGSTMALVPRRREALDNVLGGQSWAPPQQNLSYSSSPPNAR